MKTFYDMISDLLDMKLIKERGEVVFSDEAKELIHKIAEKCDEYPAVPHSSKQEESYSLGLSAGDVYKDMIFKIVNAPTSMHEFMTVRMLIPVIDKKLRNDDV